MKIIDQPLNSSNKGKTTNIIGKLNRKSSLRGYDFSWIYLALFTFLLVFGFLSNPAFSTKEIGSSFLYYSLLAGREIEKMAVLNVELVLIYIKKEPLEDPRHKEITEGVFGFKTGPHYSIAIESIEAFKNKLQIAQREFALDDRIEIKHEYRTSWSKLFSWILPLVGVIILFMLIWPTIKRKTR